MHYYFIFSKNIRISCLQYLFKILLYNYTVAIALLPKGYLSKKLRRITLYNENNIHTYSYYCMVISADNNKLL